MERVKSFADTKIGDKFYVYERYSKSKRIVVCEKITPKRVTIGGLVYVKETAKGLGGGTFSSPPTVFQLTPEIEKEVSLLKMRKHISFVDADALSEEQVRRIYAICKEKPNEVWDSANRGGE